MRQKCNPLRALAAASGHSRHAGPAIVASALLLFAAGAFADIRTTVEYHAEDQDSPGFTFTNIPVPSRNDAATAATFTMVTGEAAVDGDSLGNLHDGKLPLQADEPMQNFFFASGTDGGRIQVDLGSAREIKQVNTYSRHPSTRGPQVYQLYASTGEGKDFIARPDKGAVPQQCGWKRIARVDTRPGQPERGAQCGVSIADTAGAIGRYRYLLFDISPAETDDDFGNTFYSEIDVVELNAPVQPAFTAGVPPIVTRSADGYCEISIDTTMEPALADWAEHKLAPTLAEWYPRIAAMLPGDGFTAPKKFSVVLRPGDGVAETSGTRIVGNSVWLGGELQGEALGALIHEVVHVVQQYGGGQPDGRRAPGWLVEGIPDYIRFFKFEPASHGADRVWLQGRKKLNLNYDGMYRVSANFLDYVVEHYDPDRTIIRKVNAACRQGAYTDAIWQKLTGKTLLDLNAEWKSAIQKQLADKNAGTGESPAS